MAFEYNYAAPDRYLLLKEFAKKINSILLRQKG